MRARIRESFPMTLVRNASSKELTAIFVAAGRSKTNFYWPGPVLEEAAAKFTGAPIYVDHASASEEYERPERSLRDLVGIILDPRYGMFETPQGTIEGVGGTIRLARHASWIREMYEDGIAGEMSIVAYIDGKVEEDGTLVCENIVDVVSVDFVTQGAAGGQLVTAQSVGSNSVPKGNIVYMDFPNRRILQDTAEGLQSYIIRQSDDGATLTDLGTTPTDGGETPTDGGETPTDENEIKTDTGEIETGGSPTSVGVGATPDDLGPTSDDDLETADDEDATPTDETDSEDNESSTQDDENLVTELEVASLRQSIGALQTDIEAIKNAIQGILNPETPEGLEELLDEEAGDLGEEAKTRVSESTRAYFAGRKPTREQLQNTIRAFSLREKNYLNNEGAARVTGLGSSARVEQPKGSSRSAVDAVVDKYFT